MGSNNATRWQDITAALGWMKDHLGEWTVVAEYKAADHTATLRPAMVAHSLAQKHADRLCRLHARDGYSFVAKVKPDGSVVYGRFRGEQLQIHFPEYDSGPPD